MIADINTDYNMIFLEENVASRGKHETVGPGCRL